MSIEIRTFKPNNSGRKDYQDRELEIDGKYTTKDYVYGRIAQLLTRIDKNMVSKEGILLTYYCYFLNTLKVRLRTEDNETNKEEDNLLKYVEDIKQLIKYKVVNRVLTETVTEVLDFVEDSYKEGELIRTKDEELAYGSIIRVLKLELVEDKSEESLELSDKEIIESIKTYLKIKKYFSK